MLPPPNVRQLTAIYDKKGRCDEQVAPLWWFPRTQHEVRDVDRRGPKVTSIRMPFPVASFGRKVSLKNGSESKTQVFFRNVQCAICLSNMSKNFPGCVCLDWKKTGSQSTHSIIYPGSPMRTSSLWCPSSRRGRSNVTSPDLLICSSHSCSWWKISQTTTWYFCIKPCK